MERRPIDDLLCELQLEELKDKFAEAIRRLPPPERLIFTLYYHEELATSEIASVLGENEASITRIHSSALALLNSSLADEE